LYHSNKQIDNKTLKLNNMKTKKTYYFIIEQCGENIGQQGYYMTISEAEKRMNDLRDMFTHSEFYIFPNNSPKEPNFLTV